MKQNNWIQFGRWKSIRIPALVVDVMQYDSDWDWGDVRLQVGIRLRDTAEGSLNMVDKPLVRWEYHLSLKHEQRQKEAVDFLKKKQGKSMYSMLSIPQSFYIGQ